MGFPTNALASLTVVLGYAAPSSRPWTLVGYIGDWMIWLTFLAEVVLMLRVVPDRRKWIRKHP